MSTTDATDAPRTVEYTETLTVTDERPTVAKAIIAGVTALSGTLTTALADAGITATEWVAIVAGTIIAAAAVYAVTNKR